MIRPLFYKVKLRRWVIFLTREEIDKISDWQKGVTESQVYDFLISEELQIIWRRSKNILRATGMKSRMEADIETEET